MCTHRHQRKPSSVHSSNMQPHTSAGASQRNQQRSMAPKSVPFKPIRPCTFCKQKKQKDFTWNKLRGPGASGRVGSDRGWCSGAISNKLMSISSFASNCNLFPTLSRFLYLVSAHLSCLRPHQKYMFWQEFDTTSVGMALSMACTTWADPAQSVLLCSDAKTVTGGRIERELPKGLYLWQNPGSGNNRLAIVFPRSKGAGIHLLALCQSLELWSQARSSLLAVFPYASATPRLLLLLFGLYPA